MIRPRTGLALVPGALALVLGSAALAQGETHVLLVGRSEKDPSVMRIEQELRILGLEVEFVPANRSRGRLADRARQRGATAAAEVQADPPAILLWTDPIRFPDVGGGPELRVDESSAGTAEPGLLALRAVELLHGRILPVLLPPQAADASDGGPSSAPQSTSTAAAVDGANDTGRPSRFSAFAGPALLLSSGADPAFAAWIGARFSLIDRVDLELTGGVPLTSTSVTGLTGTAAARLGTVGLAADFRFLEPSSRLFVSAGLGLGAMFAVVSGDAKGASHAALGARAGALPFLRVGAGYWFADHVALRGDALLGVALPALTLEVKGDDVASLGTPAAVVSVALEVRP